MFKQTLGCTVASHSLLKSLRLASLFLLLLWIFAHSPNTQASGYCSSSIQSLPPQQGAGTQSTPEVTTLELGKPVERELAGGQRHGYQITLAEGQYAFVVVEQRGIDVFVQLLGTDGKLISSFDFEIRNQGQERIAMVAETAGSYGLLVNARNPKLPDGRYEIRLVEVRDATEKDRWLHESAKLRTESARLSDAGKYDEALPLAEKTLELRERLFGAESPNLVYSLLNLAFLNFRKGDYAKAEALYLRGLMITEKGLGSEHKLVARFLTNLADTYSATGDDARAVPLYQRALFILEKNFGADHPQIAHALHRLGIVYRNLGGFVHAEPLLQRSLMMSEKSLGGEHPGIASSLGHLAGLYRAKGDYTRAELLHQRALTILEKKLRPDHPDFVAPLNNLANVYNDKGDYDKAELLYRRALSIEEKALGPNHPDVACTRGNLALLLYARGDYAKAEPLYLSALAAREKALGPNHPMVGLNLSNLANLYFAVNDYAKAELLYHRALSIYETAYGANYYFLASILVDLAKMSTAQRQLAQAVAYQARANAIIEQNLHLNLTIGSERQKLAYLVSLPEQMSQAISLHARFALDDKAARELAATTVVQRKGRVQDALSHSLASLHNRFNAEDQALLEQLKGASSQLGRLVLSEPQCGSLTEHQNQIKALEERREQLESEISRRSAEFYVQSQPVTLAAIRSAIPDDAALIELAVYRPLDPKAINAKAYGEPRYVVYVIRNQGEVRWTELGPAKEIDNAVGYLRQALRDPQRKDVQQLARMLDKKVMQSVRGLVGEATQLLVSPDGALNLLPFEALVDEQGRYLIERYAFTYLTSGRDLLRMQVARESKSTPTVVANPSFGEPVREQIASAAARPALPGRRRRSVTAALDLSEVYFAPLGGTAQEARTIQTLYPGANLLTGARATESALKQVAAPHILHIATHGFFLQDGRSPEPGNPQVATRGISANAKIENPLLRSGLALAGANLTSSGVSDDGILTALEASGLNLWGTTLVVLSACDTGIGEVRNGEGVYGLRRAFVLAGAESLIMSLWPVSDYSTRNLMVGYYKNLKLGLGRGAALRQVQLDLLKRNRQLHPFYWANFIQSGDWTKLNGKR